MIWNHHSLTLLLWLVNTQEGALWSKRATSLCLGQSELFFMVVAAVIIGNSQLPVKRGPAEVLGPHRHPRDHGFDVGLQRPLS